MRPRDVPRAIPKRVSTEPSGQGIKRLAVPKGVKVSKTRKEFLKRYPPKK